MLIVLIERFIRIILYILFLLVRVRSYLNVIWSLANNKLLLFIIIIIIITDIPARLCSKKNWGKICALNLQVKSNLLGIWFLCKKVRFFSCPGAKVRHQGPPRALHKHSLDQVGEMAIQVIQVKLTYVLLWRVGLDRHFCLRWDAEFRFFFLEHLGLFRGTLFWWWTICSLFAEV